MCLEATWHPHVCCAPNTWLPSTDCPAVSVPTVPIGCHGVPQGGVSSCITWPMEAHAPQPLVALWLQGAHDSVGDMWVEVAQGLSTQCSTWL